MYLPVNIDLRSDTVTRPTDAMRHAMASAVVGDDVFDEDPTVHRLQATMAELLGKESALFVPSGTMANQIALLVHTRPGDEVVVSEGAHCVWYESGASAAWAGVQFAVASNSVMFTPDELSAAVKPPVYYYARTSLVALENTHNRGGGRVLPQPVVEAVAVRARSLGLSFHLDGARLFNASVASKKPPRELAAPFDTLSVCLSKGLGAPIGSLLVGDRARITAAHRFRKMLGGGMRQVGVLAAAGLYALEHHVNRLADDHTHAQGFAHAAAQSSKLTVMTPETNIVMVDVAGDAASRPAEILAAKAKERGVLLSVFGPCRIRAVTHLDVTAEACTRAGSIVAELAGD
jgi:threonine aldolase